MDKQAETISEIMNRLMSGVRNLPGVLASSGMMRDIQGMLGRTRSMLSTASTRAITQAMGKIKVPTVSLPKTAGTYRDKLLEVRNDERT